MKRFVLLQIVFIALLYMAMLPALQAQTAWTDSGTVNNSDPAYTVISLTGTINGTGSLTSLPFYTPQPSAGKIFTLAKYYTQTGTVKVTIKRQSSWFTDQWTDVKTLMTSDSVKTQRVVADTVFYFPQGNRFVITGTSGNGTNTVFRYKIFVPRE